MGRGLNATATLLTLKHAQSSNISSNISEHETDLQTRLLSSCDMRMIIVSIDPSSFPDPQITTKMKMFKEKGSTLMRSQSPNRKMIPSFSFSSDYTRESADIVTDATG